jgi:hypothetical protein
VKFTKECQYSAAVPVWAGGKFTNGWSGTSVGDNGPSGLPLTVTGFEVKVQINQCSRATAESVY